MARHEPDFGDLLKSITDRIDTLERRAQVTPGTNMAKTASKAVTPFFNFIWPVGSTPGVIWSPDDMTPSLSNVPIPTGHALVTVTANVDLTSPGAFPSSNYMYSLVDFDVLDDHGVIVRAANSGTALSSQSVQQQGNSMRASAQTLVDLPPGTYQFRTRYGQHGNNSGGGYATYTNRLLTVQIVDLLDAT